jgi:hypothetical protein
MYLHCRKCLTSRSGDVLGEPCKTHGCNGVIEEAPAFKTLVDELPEPMTCGRRFDTWAGSEGKLLVHGSVQEGLDHWNKFKSNGNRVCSYCGSLHWEDFTALVKQAAEAPEDAEYGSVVSIEPSDKAYKVYVHQPGVRNAHEGGIKFYMQHVPRDENGKIIVTDEQQAEYKEAIRRTRIRFDRYLNERYPKK